LSTLDNVDTHFEPLKENFTMKYEHLPTHTRVTFRHVRRRKEVCTNVVK